ncbi:hypothetical protein DT594_11290 [Halopseudomonas laoshanensis]|uniref:Lipoprotein n=1 Tax=Halopseudomonas laoshanensis TaxID=2268758 RepID=A0A7V7GSF2_9GAMM|nr:hypothetical protein [Halopseudomonas laoshanensis]KAA0693903.1 hypothetical protein DT594_11290 [Halopseudomonas laoshanensis]
MKLKRMVLFICVIAISIAGCGKSDISTVRNGTISNYNSTTIDKAFSASFDKAEWQSYETERGERIVKFSGKISEKLHREATYKIDLFIKKEGPEADFENKNQLWHAIEYFKRINSTMILDLNQAYRCDPTPTLSGVISPNCDDQDNNQPYLLAALTAFSEAFWKAGTPVEVLWLVHTNGNTFELLSMSSPEWEGLEFRSVLDKIYGR